MSTGYTYEIWTPSGDLRSMGCFTSDDLVYQGDDLAQVAAEMVNVRLAPPPWEPELEGEIRLWTVATGLRQTTPPDYVGDIADLKAAG